MAKTASGKTIEPVKTQALGSVTPPKVAPETQPAPDPVEAWLENNPANKDFSVDALPATTGQTTTLEAPPLTDAVVEPQSTPPVGDTSHSAASDASTPPVADRKDSDPPSTQAPTTPKTEVKPAEKPVAVVSEPVRVSSEGKYRLSDDGEPWTGEQIVMALRERAQALPRAEVASKFEGLFGFTYEQAEAQWKPVLTALAADPAMTQFLNHVMFEASPEEREYYLRSRAHYETEVPADQARKAVQPQAAAAIPPEAQKEIDALKSWRQEKEKSEAIDRVNRELAAAISKYPMLATDKALRDDLLQTAAYMNSRDASKGIADALATKASIYDALQVARSAQPQAPTQLHAVPALNGSAGASPTGTRPAANDKPKKFDDLTDAVEDWATNETGKYQ